MMGSVLLAIGVTPLWMAFSMRDRGREAQGILDTYERADTLDTPSEES